MEVITKEYIDFLFTTDSSQMDVNAIHDFLAKHSGWSNDIPLERVQKSIEHSLNFGIFHGGQQIGFARVISDFATIAYLGDVYILDKYRGKGLSKQLMDMIMSHPELQGLRRWILLTSTADWLYEKYGFVKLPKPEVYMEKFDPLVYLSAL
ncbi:MAG: GNAT family N-acetyltransferase [Saprospiraceae bacterium]|jgi:N-acetylglutamate synthase-like GNAT family acetyltransferase|nr:GNAT family N-acetyltransferase [Saprospiraceae bacterium]MBP9194301.1 GNAT family N-acetyltransferase [Saprospiraceae bacterium]